MVNECCKWSQTVENESRFKGNDVLCLKCDNVIARITENGYEEEGFE